MFYHKQENNYIWFKSDKDKFWFGPFEQEIKDIKQIENIKVQEQLKDFKTYKNLIWVWQKKIFMFTYSAKSGLNLEKTIDLFS